MARIERERGLQVVERRVVPPFGQRDLRCAPLGFGRVRHETLDEFTQLALRQHADELVDRLRVGERDDVGDAAHLEMLGQLRVLVDVDLHELPFARVFLLELFEHRAERLAGLAPRRPKIDQHRRERRCVDYVVFECSQGGVHCVLVRQSAVGTNEGGHGRFQCAPGIGPLLLAALRRAVLHRGAAGVSGRPAQCGARSGSGMNSVSPGTLPIS